MKKLLLLSVILLLLTGCSNSNKIKIGVIQFIQHEALDNATKGFEDALKEKYGNNIEIEVKNASGDSATCSVIATSFVAEGVDLIMANATPALQSAAHATKSIPILGTSVTEYGVALDLDNFSGIVGTNVSGTSDLAPLEDQAQMIIDLCPNAKNIGLLYCSGEQNSLYQVKVVGDYLKTNGLNVKEYAFSDSNEVASVAIEACNNIDALYIPTDNTCASYGSVIKTAAEEKNIPIIAGEKDTLKVCGGLATLSIDYYELGKTTGQMAIKVLEGEDISKMPIEYYKNPTKMFIKQTSDRLKIEIPSEYEEIGD